jgi:hypothetical protein
VNDLDGVLDELVLFDDLIQHAKRLGIQGADPGGLHDQLDRAYARAAPGALGATQQSRLFIRH